MATEDCRGGADPLSETPNGTRESMTALAIQHGRKIDSSNGHSLTFKSEVGKGIAADFRIRTTGPSAIWIFSEIFALNLAGERCFSLALLSWISICRSEIAGHSKVNRQTKDISWEHDFFSSINTSTIQGRTD
jgi:hypothetical protein